MVAKPEAAYFLPPTGKRWHQTRPIVSMAKQSTGHLIRCNFIAGKVGHKSRDPCFHEKNIEAVFMTFVAHCTCRLHYVMKD